jgi:hypothetical protein
LCKRPLLFAFAFVLLLK